MQDVPDGDEPKRCRSRNEKKRERLKRKHRAFAHAVPAEAVPAGNARNYISPLAHDRDLLRLAILGRMACAWSCMTLRFCRDAGVSQSEPSSCPTSAPS